MQSRLEAATLGSAETHPFPSHGGGCLRRSEHESSIKAASLEFVCQQNPRTCAAQRPATLCHTQNAATVVREGYLESEGVRKHNRPRVT